MSFFSTAAKAVRLGREYSEATDAALKCAEEGGSLELILFTFAGKTENQLDDAAVDILLDGINKAIDVAQTVTHLAAVWAPRLSEWGVAALKLEQRLRRFRG